MGKPSHNQYNTRSTPTEVRVIRRHHPLEGQLLHVVSSGPAQIVVRLANDTPMRMPRAWTDADGSPSGPCAERVFSVDSMLELLELVAVLGRRP
jgi:hypothetical protein